MTDSVNWCSAVFVHQEALGQICEYSEAGIAVRGTYYPPNKEPKEGDRKLYLGIEATNELAIQKAKTEIIRLIKEELQRLVCAVLLVLVMVVVVVLVVVVVVVVVVVR